MNIPSKLFFVMTWPENFWLSQHKPINKLYQIWTVICLLWTAFVGFEPRSSHIYLNSRHYSLPCCWFQVGQLSANDNSMIALNIGKKLTLLYDLKNCWNWLKIPKQNKRIKLCMSGSPFCPILRTPDMVYSLKILPITHNFNHDLLGIKGVFMLKPTMVKGCFFHWKGKHFHSNSKIIKALNPLSHRDAF